MATRCEIFDKCSHCHFPGRCPIAAIPALLLRTRSSREWRYYGNNTVVFRQNQVAAGLMLIHSGWLRLYLTSPAGKRVSVGVMGPGSAVGIGEIVNEVPYAFTAETGEETEIEFLGADHVRKSLKDTPELAVELLRLVIQQKRNFLAQLAGVSRVPADRRLWNLLLDLSKSSSYGVSGVDVKLQVCIQDISDQIGCTRQWTSKLLTDLEIKGKIKRTGGWIILHGKRTPRSPRGKSIGPVAVPALAR